MVWHQGPMFKIVNAPWNEGSIYLEGYPSGRISSTYLLEVPSVEDNSLDLGEALSAFFGHNQNPSVEKQPTTTEREEERYEPGIDEITKLADMLAEDVYGGRKPPRSKDIPFSEFPREEGRNTHQDTALNQALMEVRAYPGEGEIETLELPWASFTVNSYYEVEVVADVIEEYPPPNSI